MTNSIDLSMYMETAEFCATFKKSYAAVYPHIKKGHIHSVSVGRTRLIPRTELHDFPRRMREIPKTAPPWARREFDPDDRAEVAYRLRYRDSLTYAAIGEHLDVSGGRAAQIVAEGLRARRRPRNAARMLEMLPTLTDREFCDIYGCKERTAEEERGIRERLEQKAAEYAQGEQVGSEWYHFPPEEQRPEWADWKYRFSDDDVDD